MAGLLAARVLSDFFAHVTIVERDVLNGVVEARKGVPQGRHIHGLLAGGLAALETLFPGISDQLVARGAIPVDVGDLGTWYIAGLKMPPVITGLRGMLASRPLIEDRVRALVRERPNIRMLDGASAQGLLGSAEAITGVRIQHDGPERKLTELKAALVLDATGRGSRLPGWLEQLGLEAPREELVRADVTYTSCYVKKKPGLLGEKHCYIFSPSAPHLRSGAALQVEGDRVIVTLAGYLGESCAPDYASMIAFAKGLPVPGLHALLRKTEALSEPAQMRDPTSRRRHYQELSQFPRGLLVFGDALCSFNPSYGQGMTVAALEALALSRCLAREPADLFQSFTRAATKVIDVPWAIVVGADFDFSGVGGKRPLSTPVVNAYWKRLCRAALVSPEAATAMYKVMHLVAPPASLFAPGILGPVLIRGSRSSAAVRAASPAAELGAGFSAHAEAAE